MDVIYINNPENFDKLWNLIPDDPEDNLLTKEMFPLLPSDLSRSYLLISHKKRVISFNSSAILKHIIGQNPISWKYSCGGPIEKTIGPLHIISDNDLLEKGILSLVDNIFYSNRQDHTKEYKAIIGKELQLGDIVHIPVYDHYSIDHNDIYRHLLIYDGNKLVYPEEGNNYGFVSPKETPFPTFPLEYFTSLGRSGQLLDGYRWVTSDIIQQYNNAETVIYDNNYHVKSLNITGHIYYFAGEQGIYPVEMRKIHIDEPCNYTHELCDIDYLLVLQ